MTIKRPANRPEGVPMEGVQPNRQDFDRFLKIIGKKDVRGGIDASAPVAASMLLAVLSFFVAAFGAKEAQDAVERFVEDFFEDLKRKTQ